MFKSSNVQMFRFSVNQMFQCLYVQLFKCSNVLILKCSNVQMFKYSNVQMFKCSNVKNQMSNVNKVKLLSGRTSGSPQVIFLLFLSMVLEDIINSSQIKSDQFQLMGPTCQLQQVLFQPERTISLDVFVLIALLALS